MVGRLCVPLIPLDVQHLSARLMVVKAPGTEIARALAMLFGAQRVRTGIGPERDITPVTPRRGPFEEAWSHAETHGA